MKKGIPFATCHAEAVGFLSSSERMTHSQRNLGRGTFSRAAGKTSYARKKVTRPDADGLELLHGIPDHVTMEYIASKLEWKTCNVLQLVSRAWRQAIYNRNVYDARVFSKSTKAFLVVLSFEDQAPLQKLVLTLYSCRDGYFRRLPPIPPRPQVRAYPDCVDCICLEGRVYLWIRQRRDARRVQLYVLDLAGHTKWKKRKPVNYPVCHHGFGILDGKIYRFQSKYYSWLNLDDPFQGALSIEEKVQELPHTETYDPVHDTWSLVTPTPPVSAVVSNVDLERHLALSSDWAEEKLAADPSKTFLTNGRYESYFSKWKQKLSRECSTTSTVGNDSGFQVYYLNLLQSCRCQEMLFLGGKLVRYEKLRFYTVSCGADTRIQEYNTRTNIWEHWKSISMKFQRLKKDCTFSIKELEGFAAANNSIWAMAGVYFVKDGRSLLAYFLVRSPELLDDDDVKSVTWIDTGFQVPNNSDCGTFDARSWHRVKPILRPIYL